MVISPDIDFKENFFGGYGWKACWIDLDGYIVTGSAVQFNLEDGSMAGFDCQECHMPKLVKNAVGHDAVGSGPKTGNIAVHIFKINLDGSSQFTADGKFAYPWVTKDFACLTWHNGVDASDRSTIDDTGYVFHQ